MPCGGIIWMSTPCGGCTYAMWRHYMDEYAMWRLYICHVEALWGYGYAMWRLYIRHVEAVYGNEKEPLVMYVCVIIYTRMCASLCNVM